MRGLRLIGLVLGGWALAATIYQESGVRQWVRQPSAVMAEMGKRKAERGEHLILAAAIAAVACWVLASVIETIKRAASNEASEWSDGADSLSPESGSRTIKTVSPREP